VNPFSDISAKQWTCIY